VSRWGAEAWEAHTLEEARAFAARTPDLALVDLWLAGEYAIGLFEELRRRHPPPAVVAISGRVSPEQTFRLGELGVRAFLAKPFFHEQLIATVEQALAQERSPASEDHSGVTAGPREPLRSVDR
jgi:DNA-binding response OmpR family regulator